MHQQYMMIIKAMVVLLLAAGCGPTTESLPTFAAELPTSTSVPEKPIPTLAPTDTAIPPTVTPELPTETPPPTPTPDVPFEIVSFTTEDGIEIAATLFGQGDPVLIMLHMGKGNADQSSWHAFARLAAEQDFTSLTLDFRGRGESGGELKTSEMILDARAAVEFLRARGYERFVCLGASMGGTTCMRLALDEDLIGLVVISSTQSVGQDNSVSSSDLAALTIPKLFVYSTKDIAIRSAMDLMYQVSAEPKSLLLYDHMAHGTDLFNTPDGDDLRQELFKFLEGFH